MTPTPYTVLPFLMALVVGLAGMALPIYDVHAWERGIEHASSGKTRRTSDAPVVIDRPAGPGSRWAALIVDERGEGTVDLLTVGIPRGIKALRQLKADLVAAADKNLTEKPEGWADRDDQFTAKLAEVNDGLSREERLQEHERTLTPLPPDSTAEERAIQVQVRDRAEDDPKRGFRDHKDYLLAVMRAGKNLEVDARLKPLAAAGSDEQGAYSDPHGAYFLPTAIAPNVMALQAEDDPLAGRTTDVEMTAPMVKINARVDKNHSASVSGGLVVTRRPETVDGSSSRMTFEQIGLEAQELFGLAYATERILQDSPQSFISILAAGFRDEFVSKAIDERLNGTGVGEPLGAMKAGCLITVAAEAGQDATTIVTKNIENMAARCWRFGRAVWLANHTTRPQLMSLVREVGTGGAPIPYFRFAEREGQLETLLGRPIFFTEYAKALGTKGDLLLGVWSEYLDGRYQPLQSAESIHVRFAANERAFKFWLRNDGQPWWRSVLTPKNGDTLSPFVTLAAR